MAGLARQPHTLCSATVSEVVAWNLSSSSARSRCERAGLDITEGLSSDKQQLGRKHLADRVPMARD